jgi:hypothetical protein
LTEPKTEAVPEQEDETPFEKELPQEIKNPQSFEHPSRFGRTIESEDSAVTPPVTKLVCAYNRPDAMSEGSIMDLKTTLPSGAADAPVRLVASDQQYLIKGQVVSPLSGEAMEHRKAELEARIKDDTEHALLITRRRKEKALFN